MANIKHELERKQLKYKAMDTTKKQDLLSKKAAQYITMDIAKKQDLLNKKAEQYKTMDTAKKQDLILNEKAEQYKTIDTAKKNLFNKKAIKLNCNIVLLSITTAWLHAIMRLVFNTIPLTRSKTPLVRDMVLKTRE